MSRHPVLVCAAGVSSSCPGGKLLQLWKGEPLLFWLIQTLEQHPRVERVVVVCGDRQQEIHEVVHRFAGLELHHNPQWTEGLSSSLRLGASLLPSGDGFVVTLGDTPLFHPDTLDRVLPWGKVRTVNVTLQRGQPGHPLYVPEWARQDWHHLEGDQTTKHLLPRWGDQVHYIPVNDSTVARDFHQD